MNLARGLRLRLARLPMLRRAVPEAPALTLRDLWSGDALRGAELLRSELTLRGASRVLKPGAWIDAVGLPALSDYANGFTWLRDLRALGSDAARLRARALVSDWMVAPEPRATRPDVAGARIAAWIGHYDFFAASADDAFRARLMRRIVADARALAVQMPAEVQDGRALTAFKGLIAAGVALPEHANHLTRALRFLPPEIARQVLPDGSHAERSPAAHLAALQDLIEIRFLLQTAKLPPPTALNGAIERLAGALRTLRHPDGGLALFNGTLEESGALIEQVLTQAGRIGRALASLPDGGFYRLQAGRTVLIADAGPPPARGLDRFAHAGTLSFEMSVGRDRLVVNCGAAPPGSAQWHDAARSTAAHSTLTISDTSSSELKPEGLGRRPERVVADRQEANGAHWLEAHHDGYRRAFGAIHRRRLYLAESGEDVRGEDVVEAATGQPFTVRFHLHPAVNASVQQDNEAVLLRLPGSFWRLRAEGAKITLEESIYLGTVASRRSEQVVLTGFGDGAQHVKWAITKVG